MNFPINIEQWRLIDGYDNYEISSHGRVRNNKTSQIMKLSTTTKGYMQVGLSKDKEKKKFFVHRLVGFAFLEKRDEDSVVDHIDHSKSNNMITNLRWLTMSEKCRNQPISARNTSGTTGVSYDKTDDCWRANWFEEKSKRKCKSFNVQIYGNEKAKQMAVDYRKQMAEANGYLNV